MAEEEEDYLLSKYKREKKLYENIRFLEYSLKKNLIKFNDQDPEDVKFQQLAWEAQLISRITYGIQVSGISFFTFRYFYYKRKTHLQKPIFALILLPTLLFKMNPSVRWYNSKLIDMASKHDKQLDEIRQKIKKEEEDSFIDEEALNKKLEK